MKPVSAAALFAALITAVPSLATAQEAALSSRLPAYQVAPGDQLPELPAGSEQECRSAPAQTPAGRALEARGWQVVSEIAQGSRTLVTFAAVSSPGVQGACEFENGALGVFEGGGLLGLYRNTEDGTGVFGRLETEREGVVDLWTSTFPQVAVAEIVSGPQGVLLQARPETLPGCGGRVEVPQHGGARLSRMRERLIAHGWTPLTPVAADPVSADLQARGFPEAESCSGTGVNYCSYDYARPGARFRLITVGELGDYYEPVVADYELTCEETAQ